ncbi:acyl-CoA thioesterase [Nocardioides sp. cx-169]|uniref:acyl-CoA thioesterase n=1 Tax=Nocardioides sp. cx-169 TaxID=2899080 RepID=UPI001E636690|nr:thioesterase family protein [Nocardioides sp. cx-169]MCD4535839.1 acyl-CoA thioesterase [Nocardioides sp. cx-169]
MRHVYDCPMRWADLDLLGHVNNVVYVDYLQEARVDLLRTHGPSATGQLAGTVGEGLVVVRHEVTYVGALEFRFRPVRIECWVTEIRAATFTMAYEIFHEDPETEGGRRVYLRAATVLTPYVFETERPRRLSPTEQQALGAYLEPAPRARPPRREPLSRTTHYPVHVRFSDVDVYGHVNNVKYFEYLQEARIRMVAGLSSDLASPRAPVVVAQTDVDYRMPLVFRPEPYDCWSRIVRVGRRSMTIDSEIRDGELLMARAQVTTVFYDPETGRSTDPPADLRAVLEAASG